MYIICVWASWELWWFASYEVLNTFVRDDCMGFTKASPGQITFVIGVLPNPREADLFLTSSLPPLHTQAFVP